MKNNELSRERFKGTGVFIDNIYGKVESLSEVEALYLHEKGEPFTGSLEELAEALDYTLVPKLPFKELAKIAVSITDGESDTYSDYYYEVIADIDYDSLSLFDYTSVVHDGNGFILFLQ